MKFIVSLTILGLFLPILNGARILGIFHVEGYSHQIVPQKIMKELALRGHDVTVVTPLKIKDPVKNMKIIEVPLKFIEEDQIAALMDEESLDIISNIMGISEWGLNCTKKFLKEAQSRGVMNLEQKYDLVILENFLNEAFRGFCYHFKAPCVLISPVGASRWSNGQMGNPSSPSYVPDLLLTYSSKMSFWERTCNSLAHLLGEIYDHLVTLPAQNELMHEYFPKSPHLNELYYNASLMLLTSHVSTQQAVPLVPNMIDVGGLHIDPPKKLPKDLQQYLDNAKDGVIYFSLGSNLRSKDLPREKLEGILKSFMKLKQKILWKWEDEVLPNQPKNVKLGKWLPQTDILAHPNVKLFITHGGLMSTIETIYHGVPVLGIPFYGDQKMNIAHAEASGVGLGVPYSKVNEQTLDEAINAILRDPKFAENAKRLSRVMHDQPLKPLDRAMFWIEYVMRHGGAPHLRVASLDLAWYQYLLLDVAAAVLSFATIFSLILFIVIRQLCKIIRKPRSPQKSNKKEMKKKN